MKTAVIYATKSGHSKKIADAIAKELATTSYDVKQNPSIDAIDLLYIVGGIYGSQSAPELLDYIRSLDNSKVKETVLITSCVSRKIKQEEARRILTEKNILVKEEEFVCQGSFLFIGRKHPDAADINDAVSFAKKAAKIR